MAVERGALAHASASMVISAVPLECLRSGKLQIAISTLMLSVRD